MTYFADREFGERPRTQEEIGEVAWGGLQALVYARVEDGSLGAGYPAACEDGRGPKGTNEDMLRPAMHAEIPGLPFWPWLSQPNELPETVRVLELIEFCWRHIGYPIQLRYHDYWHHYDLRFDIELRRRNFTEDVNRIFARNGLAYTLTSEGRVERLGPPVLREELASTEFVTGNSELDRLLESARRKFLSPNEEIRREAFLELWDAWERLKTTGVGPNKKDQITSLLDDAAGSALPKFRARLETEALESHCLNKTVTQHDWLPQIKCYPKSGRRSRGRRHQQDGKTGIAGNNTGPLPELFQEGQEPDPRRVHPVTDIRR